MTTTDRTPIILACVDDILREYAGDDVERLAVALQISADLNAVVRLWPPTGDDQALAGWIVEVMRGRETADYRRFQPPALAAASMVVARLATVAASLLVRGEAWADEARTLWHAASRLLGHDIPAKAEAASAEPPASDAILADVVDEAARLNDWCRWARLRHGADEDRDDVGMRAHVDLLVFGASKLERELDDWRRWAVKKTGADPTGDDSFLRVAVDVNATAEVKRITREHAEEVAALTERLAATTADVEEALRSPVSSGPTTGEVEAAVARTVQRSSVTPSHHHRSPEVTKSAVLVTDIRKAALYAGAKDCTVFVGPGDDDLAVVVELRDGIDLTEVARILDASLPDTVRYTLREVRATRTCRHRVDGDAAACDHCSLKG